MSKRQASRNFWLRWWRSSDCIGKKKGQKRQRDFAPMSHATGKVSHKKRTPSRKRNTMVQNPIIRIVGGLNELSPHFNWIEKRLLVILSTSMNVHEKPKRLEELDVDSLDFINLHKAWTVIVSCLRAGRRPGCETVRLKTLNGWWLWWLLQGFFSKQNRVNVFKLCWRPYIQPVKTSFIQWYYGTQMNTQTTRKASKICSGRGSFLFWSSFLRSLKHLGCLVDAFLSIEHNLTVPLGP